MVRPCPFWGMAQTAAGPHDPNMYTSLKKPRVGDRVRLTGFLGVFEVVRVRPDGSLVDLKHLDLHQTAYIEHEVSAHDLIYLRGPQADDPCSRSASSLGQPAPVPNGKTAPLRPAQPSSFVPRPTPAVASQPLYARQASGRKA